MPAPAPLCSGTACLTPRPPLCSGTACLTRRPALRSGTACLTPRPPLRSGEGEQRLFRPGLLPSVLLLALLTVVASAQETPGWPLDAAQAAQLQASAAQALGVPVERTVELAPGVSLALVLVPAGSFIMGTPADQCRLDPDEAPPFQATVERPFWLGKFEITNAQFRAFDPAHNSREADTNWKDRVGPGPTLNADDQPVVRISWDQARAFCAWLGSKAGGAWRLPTEQEWEWGCRAGTDGRFSCPLEKLEAYANFADDSLGQIKPWAVRAKGRSDGAAVSATVGRYLPNPFALHDAHGNVAEWCETDYAPYPLSEPITGAGEKVVRGGSWDDMPRRARSAFRLKYAPSYRVYNVGFRVVCEVNEPTPDR